MTRQNSYKLIFYLHLKTWATIPKIKPLKTFSNRNSIHYLKINGLVESLKVLVFVNNKKSIFVPYLD